MTRHATSLARLAKLAFLIPLELAFRVLARLMDRPSQETREWTEDDHRAEW